MKLQISLDNKLVERIDNYTKSNYMSRSGFISLAVTQYLNSNEMMLAVKEMSLCMRKIADNNVVDDGAMKELEDIERLCKMLTGVK